MAVAAMAVLALAGCESSDGGGATEPAKKAAQEENAQAPTDITGAGHTETYECGGKTVNISGARNKLTFTGECSALNVTGAKNIVTVEKAGAVNVTGVGTKVTCESAADDVSVNVTGEGSSVKGCDAGADGGSDDDAEDDKGQGDGGLVEGLDGGDGRSHESGNNVYVIKSSQTDTVNCGGKGLYVNGSSNTLKVEDCSKLVVNGSNNTLSSGETLKIVINGSHNKVSVPGSPKVADLGQDNEVDKS